MVLLYLPALFLLAIAGLADTEGASNYPPPYLALTVSENGIDEIECFRSIPCNTLNYVLTQISLANFSHVTTEYIFIVVDVTYNQSIATARKYDFSALRTPLYLHITISGTEQTFINCKPYSSLAIVAGKSSIFWLWQGIAFSGCGLLSDGDGLSHSGVTHIDLSFLAILQCKALTTSFHIRNAQKVLISKTSFGKLDWDVGYCPSVIVHNAISKFVTNFLFLQNTFENCHVPSAFPGILVLNYNSHSNINISNNTFSEIHSTVSTQTAVSITGSNIINVTIQNNTILRNSLSFLYLYSEIDDTVKPVARCTIQQNCFLQNVFSADVYPYMLNLISIRYTLLSSETAEVILSENFFVGNMNMWIANIIPGAKTDGGTVSVLINKTNVTNNSAKFGLIWVEKDKPRNGVMNVSIQSLTAEGNVMIIDNIQASPGLNSIIVCRNVDEVLISEATFSNNFGTPLFLLSDKGLGALHLSLSGILLFDQNSGFLGGACALQNVVINATISSTVVFERNFGIYGGALYMENVYISSPCNMTATFINNSAATAYAGNSVYFATTPRIQENQCNLSLNISDVHSLATNIIISNNNSHIIFPGQNIVMNISITDILDSPSFCAADVYLLCDDVLHTCIDKQITLKGPENVVLVQTTNSMMTTVDTNLMLSSPEGPINSTTVALMLVCKNAEHTSSSITFNITPCPLGFYYDPKESTCKCEPESADFVCSTKVGAACVSFGHWYGPTYTANNTLVHTVGRCSFPDCKYPFEPCPSQFQKTGKYVHLGFNADQQCSEGRGGVLCRGCARGFEFSFISRKCVPGKDCSWWHPVVILLSSLSFQILIAVILVVLVRFKLALGSGFLYGPMLFLAVVNSLPLENYPEYSSLNTAVSVITSIPLLNLELFGHISWCFLPSSSKLLNYSLSYLGPLAVLVVILLISVVARWCPNALRRWQSSPLRALCILMLLSFWSLADISVNILAFTELSSVRGTWPTYVVSMQPEYKLFSPNHLPVAIPALLVLLIVIMPLLIVLLCSPLLSKLINLYRIKPFLDEFQSCYKDKYRWYSGVYLFVWSIILSIHGNKSVTIPLIQTLFFILMSTHILIQPYQSRMLNVVDTLLLIDLNFVIALLYSTFVQSRTATVIVHTLVVVPLLCIVVLFSCVCILKCGVYDYLHGLWIRRRQHSADGQQHDEEHEQPPQVPVQEVRIFEESGEREPLIGIINDE